MINAARAYISAGLSVIPADPKTKKPRVQWKAYQSTPPTVEEVESWFSNGAAVALVCGPVSGNLEVIDFDDPAAAKEWGKLLRKWNLGDLLAKLVLEESPRGGHHVIYRHVGKPDGNQKLALKPDGTVKIETRGDGGYCLVCPSDGYVVKRGKIESVPTVSADEREAMLSAARTFDEAPVEKPQPTDKVWDDYNARASIDEILVPKEWQRAGRMGEEELWVRPGKDKRHGHSATYNWKGLGLFRVFSSSCGLEARAYDKWGLYVRLWHNGDFRAATMAAQASGYGAAPNSRRVGVREQRGERKLLCMDDIEEDEMEFLVEPYIPIGVGYTLLYGDSDQGKSTAVLALISGWSGGFCPITKKSIEPIRSIILSAEDSAKYVVKPRLRQLGANMKNVFAPEEFREEGGVMIPDPMTLDEYGIEDLQRMIREANAKLVVIDPLTTYFDGDSLNDRLQARKWTTRITNLCIAEGCAIIIIHHVSKPNGMSGGRYRAAGSQDFFDGARSGLMVCHAGEDTTEYALSHEKHNYSWRGDSVGYEFSRERGFQWTGTSDLTADLAAARQAEHVEPKKKDACKKWILESLEQGPISSDDLVRGAKKEGWPFATYRRAKDEIRDQVRSWKSAEKDGPWMNELREYHDPYAD